MLIFNAMKMYRLSNKFYNKGFTKISKLIDTINRIIQNSNIPGSCEIGEYSEFAYGGIGIVLHSDVKIGKNCMIGQGITIGKQLGKQGVPTIEDNVYISAGVRIIGDIIIGNNSIIAPNSVVIKDTEPYSIYSGIPAKKIISITEDNIDKYVSYGIKKHNFNNMGELER